MVVSLLILDNRATWAWSRTLVGFFLCENTPDDNGETTEEEIEWLEEREIPMMIEDDEDDGARGLRTPPPARLPNVLTSTCRQQPPVHVVLGVRHSVLFNDALGGQVGNGTTEAISTDVISPGEAVPPG